MPVESCDDAWHGSNSLQANRVVVVLLTEEHVDEDTEKPHKAEGGFVDPVLRLVVVWYADFLQVLHGQTGRKRLGLIRQGLVALVRLRDKLAGFLRSLSGI